LESGVEEETAMTAARAIDSQPALNVRIRKGQIRDLALIVRYNCLMAEETEGIALPVDTVTAGVRSVLEEPSRGFYLLAEILPEQTPQDPLDEMYSSDGTFRTHDETPSSPPPPGPQPVGQVMITYEWSDWRCGDFWWIQSVYVQPEWRSKGIFKALFEHVREESEKRVDVVGLRLYTATTNKRAQSVYDRLGMDGDRYVVYEMEKEQIRK
jgi:GNAT superfamily N-acetyltransferase